MANNYFRFKKFTVYQDRCAMKVTTDSCFFGAWAANEIHNSAFKIENVLDLGAGTGLLSLMIAQKNDVKIDAVEIDKEAAEQSRENIECSPWKNRIYVFNENILFFQPVKKYDCIISNPPFYENELASPEEKKNIAYHSGQLTMTQILHFIKMNLKEEGSFLLMLPFKRKQEVEQLLQKNELYPTNEIVLQQSVKHSPFRVLLKGTNKKMSLENSISISIWDEHQQYTQPFIELLKDYYLYL